MQKRKDVKKITLSKETLLRLQPETLAKIGTGGPNDTGPSCAIFRGCTIPGWDC